MYNSFISLSNPIFAFIIAFLSIFIATHISFGVASKRAKDLSLLLFLWLIIGSQMYWLIQAAVYIPSNVFFVYDNTLLRQVCLESGKGGKRPKDNYSQIFLNPCFCIGNVTCTYSKSGYLTDPSLCPANGTASCKSKIDGSNIPVYIDETRNCNGGMSYQCSKLEPCYPCELNRLNEFGASRCVTCSSEYQGNCNFIPDVGPYCLKSNKSREVEPCKQCCTENKFLIIDGKCY